MRLSILVVVAMVAAIAGTCCGVPQWGYIGHDAANTFSVPFKGPPGPVSLQKTVNLTASFGMPPLVLEDGSIIIIPNYGHTLYAYTPEGNLDWTVSIAPTYFYNPSAALSANGHFLAIANPNPGSGENTIHFIGLYNYRVLWSVTFPTAPIGYLSGLLFIDDERSAVYVCSDLMNIVALSMTDGSTLWTARYRDEPGRYIFMSLSSSNGLLLIVFVAKASTPTGSATGLVALDSSSGKQMYSRVLGASVPSHAPLISNNSDTVFLSNGNLYAIDVRSGELLYTRDNVASVMALYDNNIIGFHSGCLQNMDQWGQIIWRQTNVLPNAGQQPVVTFDGQILQSAAPLAPVPPYQTTISSIDARTGKLLWTVNVSSIYEEVSYPIPRQDGSILVVGKQVSSDDAVLTIWR